MKYVTLALGILITWTMLISTQTALAEDLIERSFNIDSIERIQASGGGELTISIGEKEQLKVIAPASVLENIKVDAKGDTLRISQKSNAPWKWGHNMNQSTNKVKYKLTLNKLSSISAAGHFNINALDPIFSEDFHIHLSGASELKLQQLTLKQTLEINGSGAADIKIAEVRAHKILAEGSGASNIKISGQSQEQHLEFSGASNYHAHDLQTTSSKVEVSGASHIEIWVKEKLKGELSGASHLSYFGNPSQDVESSGASEISKNGDKPQLK